MFKITYHFKDLDLRNTIDLTYYENDLLNTAISFPMVKLIEVTPDTYTILINTKDKKKKNRIVRTFGHKFALMSELGKFVQHNPNSSTLFIAKKVKEI